MAYESENDRNQIDYNIPTSSDFAEKVKAIFPYTRWKLYDSTNGKYTYTSYGTQSKGIYIVNTKKNIYDYDLTIFYDSNATEPDIRIVTRKDGILIEESRTSPENWYVKWLINNYLINCPSTLTADEIFENFNSKYEVKSGYKVYDEVIGKFGYKIMSSIKGLGYSITIYVVK